MTADDAGGHLDDDAAFEAGVQAEYQRGVKEVAEFYSSGEAARYPMVGRVDPDIDQIRKKHLRRRKKQRKVAREKGESELLELRLVEARQHTVGVDPQAAEASRVPMGVGRPKGSEVEMSGAAILEVLRGFVDGRSGNEVADAMKKEPPQNFVNRVKVQKIKHWYDRHPGEASDAVARQEIPRDFPATPAGWLLPKP